MSFRCGLCGEAQIDGEMPQRIVTHVRPVEYEVEVFSFNRKRRRMVNSVGEETAREVLGCKSCYTLRYDLVVGEFTGTAELQQKPPVVIRGKPKVVRSQVVQPKRTKKREERR